MNSAGTKYFNLFYSDADGAIVEKIIAEIDGMYDQIVDFFELKGAVNRFDFYLCPDVESFKSYANKSDSEYRAWMVGNADYANHRICILSPRVVRDRSEEDMAKVIRHEIIHIALCALADPDKVPICVAEGIAVALAEQIYLPCLDSNDPPKYIDLSDEEYFYEHNGYNYSGAYMLFFLKRYGKEAFINIYSGKEPIEKYIYNGFEKDAILNLIS